MCSYFKLFVFTVNVMSRPVIQDSSSSEFQIQPEEFPALPGKSGGVLFLIDTALPSKKGSVIILIDCLAVPRKSGGFVLHYSVIEVVDYSIIGCKTK